MSFLWQCSHRIDSRAAEGAHDARHHGHCANYQRRACERDGVEALDSEEHTPQKARQARGSCEPECDAHHGKPPALPEHQADYAHRRCDAGQEARLAPRASPRRRLGHESVETTQIYLDADLTLTEQVLAKTKTTRAGKLTPAGII